MKFKKLRKKITELKDEAEVQLRTVGEVEPLVMNKLIEAEKELKQLTRIENALERTKFTGYTSL